MASPEIGVLVALAVVNLGVIGYLMWTLLQNLKELEETIDRFGRVR